MPAHEHGDLKIGPPKPSKDDGGRSPPILLVAPPPPDRARPGLSPRQSRGAIQEISSRHLLPVVVGGTGFYLRALLEGLFAGPPRSAELAARLRERAAERGPNYLHNLLRRVDPEAPRQIDAHPVPKWIPPLEVAIR